MSRTVKKSKGAGYEYWSRRPLKLALRGYGAYCKRWTHRKERRLAKREIYQEME